MNYAETIHEAWQMTLESKKLKWFAFVPSLVAVLVFVFEFAWHLYWFSEEFGLMKFHIDTSQIRGFLGFLMDYGLFWWVIFLVLFVLFFEFVVPSWIQATMMLSVRFRFQNPDTYFSIRQKLLEGLKYFFKLMEYKGIMLPFRLMSVILFFLSMYRYFHESFGDILITVGIGYTIFAVIVNLFWAFAPYYIVYEKEDVIPAIKKSMGLVFLNFGRTLAVILLMFFVNLRIIINVLVVLGVPFGILAVISYFAASAWFGLALSLISIIGIFAILLTSYLTAVVEVFLIAVWERTFKSLNEEQKILTNED